MTLKSKYTTAAAMRMALEQRLKKIAKQTNVALARLRRQVSFDRFLARVFSTEVKGLIAKGGYTLELRLNKARTTKDIDFSFTGNLGGVWKGEPNDLQLFLHKRSQIDLHDFFDYTVGPATLDLENAPYGGYRFPVEAQMAGRRFEAFSIDIAAGDAWFAPHEKLPVHDWLEFAGIPAIDVPVISIEQQFAEKLHAYTQLRDYPNSRVKDLVDMLLIVGGKNMSADKLRTVTLATFSKRDNSTYPPAFQNPPDDWKHRYARLARECDIEENINKAVEIVRGYCKVVGIIQE
jgi:predicted nucleotidyltransferase component of viral defense system